MKLKFIFSLIEYLGKSTEFWGDFSKFSYFPPLVDIYRHPLLNFCGIFFSRELFFAGHEKTAKIAKIRTEKI